LSVVEVTPTSTDSRQKTIVSSENIEIAATGSTPVAPARRLKRRTPMVNAGMKASGGTVAMTLAKSVVPPSSGGVSEQEEQEDRIIDDTRL